MKNIILTLPIRERKYLKNAVDARSHYIECGDEKFLALYKGARERFLHICSNKNIVSTLMTLLDKLDYSVLLVLSHLIENDLRLEKERKKQLGRNLQMERVLSDYQLRMAQHQATLMIDELTMDIHSGYQICLRLGRQGTEIFELPLKSLRMTQHTDFIDVCKTQIKRLNNAVDFLDSESLLFLIEEIKSILVKEFPGENIPHELLELYGEND